MGKSAPGRPAPRLREGTDRRGSPRTRLALNELKRIFSDGPPCP
jgi:hypothetical protein